MVPPGPLLLVILVVWLVVVAATGHGHKEGNPQGVLVATLIAGAIWYFGWYDTAPAKCERGDLGACAVVTLQQARP